MHSYCSRRKWKINKRVSVSENPTEGMQTRPESASYDKNIRQSSINNLYSEIYIYELADINTIKDKRASECPYEDVSATNGEYDHLGMQRPRRQIDFLDNMSNYGIVRPSQTIDMRCSGLYNTLIRGKPAVAENPYIDHEDIVKSCDRKQCDM